MVYVRFYFFHSSFSFFWGLFYRPNYGLKHLEFMWGLFFFSLFFFLLFFWGKDLYILWLPLYILFYFIFCFLFFLSLFIFLFMGWKGVVCVSAIFVDFEFNNSSFC